MATDTLRELLTDAFPDATELSVEDRTGTATIFR